MRHVDMSVRLISRPDIDWRDVDAWVRGLGGDEWVDRMEDADSFGLGRALDGQILVEAAGRRCYQSWTEGINANVTKVRKDSDKYLRNVIDVGHGSVLEHAQYSFALEGISRVVTHELVRHKAGTAISQESLRFVRLTDIPFRMPDWIEADDVLATQAHDLIEQMENFQKLAAERAGIDDPDRDFHYKKTVTSDMRRFAPLGLLTGMVWSANLRTLRWVLEARTAPGAEREIRELFHKVGLIMVQETPAIFADFERVAVEGSDIPAWVPARSKV